MRKKVFSAVALLSLLVAGLSASAQDGSKNGTGAPAAATSAGITANSTPMELARAALAGQGEKFKSVTSMVLIGTVNLFPPNTTQSVPGKFVMVTAGDKMRVDIEAPAVNFSFKNIYNGEQAFSSVPNVNLPPLSKFGPILLTKLDQPGYTVTALPDKKKQRAFRVADPDGNATEFYVDATTGRILAFLIPYNGLMFGTEIKKTKEVDGVIVPMNFVQRLEMTGGAYFADYTVKDVKLNQPLGDDVFAIPN